MQLANVAAQETLQVIPGTRVRISAPTFTRHRLIGTVVAKNTDMFLLKVENQDAAMHCALCS